MTIILPSLAFSSLCAIKISRFLTHQIDCRYDLSHKQFRMLRISSFCLLEATVIAGSIIAPITTTCLFVATYVASIVITKNLFKDPFLEKTSDRFLTKFSNQQFVCLPQDIANLIVVNTIEGKNPLKDFYQLKHVAEINKCLYNAAQKARAKIIDDNPDIPTFSFFSSLEEMINFAKTHEIKKLNLQEAKISNFYLIAILKAIPGITHLDISRCYQIDNEAIIAITSHLPLLKHLNISQCHKVNNAGIIAIADKLENLESLEMGFNRKVSDEALKTIASKSAKLRNLNIEILDGVTHEGFQEQYVMEPVYTT